MTAYDINSKCEKCGSGGPTYATGHKLRPGDILDDRPCETCNHYGFKIIHATEI